MELSHSKACAQTGLPRAMNESCTIQTPAFSLLNLQGLRSQQRACTGQAQCCTSSSQTCCIRRLQICGTSQVYSRGMHRQRRTGMLQQQQQQRQQTPIRHPPRQTPSQATLEAPLTRCADVPALCLPGLPSHACMEACRHEVASAALPESAGCWDARGTACSWQQCTSGPLSPSPGALTGGAHELHCSLQPAWCQGVLGVQQVLNGPEEFWQTLGGHGGENGAQVQPASPPSTQPRYSSHFSHLSGKAPYCHAQCRASAGPWLRSACLGAHVDSTGPQLTGRHTHTQPAAPQSARSPPVRSARHACGPPAYLAAGLSTVAAAEVGQLVGLLFQRQPHPRFLQQPSLTADPDGAGPGGAGPGEPAPDLHAGHSHGRPGPAGAPAVPPRHERPPDHRQAQGGFRV